MGMYDNDPEPPDMERPRAQMYWTTKNGEMVKITMLSDDHLRNIIKLFAEGKFNNEETHMRLIDEAIVRHRNKMIISSYTTRNEGILNIILIGLGNY